MRDLVPVVASVAAVPVPAWAGASDRTIGERVGITAPYPPSCMVLSGETATKGAATTTEALAIAEKAPLQDVLPVPAGYTTARPKAPARH